jgi:hypothetical protein
MTLGTCHQRACVAKKGLPTEQLAEKAREEAIRASSRRIGAEE